MKKEDLYYHCPALRDNPWCTQQALTHDFVLGDALFLQEFCYFRPSFKSSFCSSCQNITWIHSIHPECLGKKPLEQHFKYNWESLTTSSPRGCNNKSHPKGVFTTCVKFAVSKLHTAPEALTDFRWNHELYHFDCHVFFLHFHSH